jgi:flavin-dependent dehydrogenase
VAATEVLIVGGGPAGIATAAALARAGRAACVVEQTRYQAARVGEHLAPECRPLLEQLGLWTHVAAGGHLPSPGVRVAWNRDVPYERDYVFSAYGAGLNLDRRRFDESLARAALGLGVEVLSGARLAGLDGGAGEWRARLDGGSRSGTTIAARFLVDATGRCASVARRLGARRAGPDRLIALGAWLEDGETGAADPWLCVEPVASGWWYAAALPERRLAAVLLTDRDLVPGGAASAQQLWKARASETHHVAPLLHHYRQQLAFRISAAQSFHLEPPAGPGWLAVGDAAMAVDPLSSMGILLALRSGLAAARAIGAHLDGDDTALERHAREVAQRFDGYLAERAAVYTLERRWPGAPFWERRRTPVTSSPPARPSLPPL